MFKDEIQQKIKTGFDSLKKQKDQFSYNKLYNEYKTLSVKYSSLFNDSLSLIDNEKTKKNGKTIEAQVRKEKQKIDNLLEKMKKFPELHKEKEKTIERDFEIIEMAQNLSKYKILKNEVDSVLLKIKTLNNEERDRKALILTTQQKIDELKSLALHKMETGVDSTNKQHNHNITASQNDYNNSKYNLELEQYKLTIMKFEDEDKQQKYKENYSELDKKKEILNAEKIDLETKLGFLSPVHHSKTPDTSYVDNHNTIPKMQKPSNKFWTSQIAAAKSSIMKIGNTIRNISK